MKAVILRTKPGSSFHFGDYVPFSETFLDHTNSFPHSDTIFSALVNIFNQVWPDETEKFIGHFRAGRIRLSSGMFCFTGKTKTLFFLPRPAMMKIDDESERREMKNIEWVSAGIWEKGMGKNLSAGGPVRAGKHFVCLAEEWKDLTEARPEKFTAYELIPVPRVTVHSHTREDTLYQQTNIILRGSEEVSVSYYFLTEHDGLEPEARKKLETVISLLPDTGLGGQRTTGCGFFEGIDWVANPLPEVKDEAFYVNLGLFSPGNELQNCLAYRVLTRGGRRTENGQLKKILLVREGAVINRNPAGRIADLSPGGDGSFLRYGIPLCWPVSKRLINL